MPIDRDLKRCLGQMIKGVQVVGACAGGEVRAYTSHWITQVSFEEPIVMASTSPKHDTHPLMVESGRFGVSILAADQIEEGQYFSYPGRRFRRIAEEFLVMEDGLPFVPGAIAWLACDIFDRVSGRFDHDLFFARVSRAWEGRLGENPLAYSARHGWRVVDGPAREPGVSIRDRLLERLANEDED
ncbi:MAG TPA: flavin reductase family protein [Acidimicrobiia bacterium]|nr:flavin reductase family protein [Acidimicrobiia bacterium]